MEEEMYNQVTPLVFLLCVRPALVYNTTGEISCELLSCFRYVYSRVECYISPQKGHRLSIFPQVFI
jgi:hypothetical protein